MPAPRHARIADQIQRSLAETIRLELRDPRVGMLTLTGVEVSRLTAPASRFARDLVAGRTVEAACAAAAAAGVGAEALLAEHLACGRFVDFHVAEAAHGAAA